MTTPAACARGEGAFAAVVGLLQGFRAGADVELCACLDLSLIARNALHQLPDWLARMTDERQAAARLLFKDAVELSDDAGPRLIEILFAHLAEPWTILRVMSALMPKPGDRYASSSELADFGERLLRDIDRRAQQVRSFDHAGGAPAGREAAEALRIAAAVASEFEQTLVMSRDGPWGERLAKQKQGLAASAEGHLKKLDKMVGEALPMQPVRIGGRTMRTEPRLGSPPDATAVRRAQALLAFFDGIRSTAAQGGYGTIRGQGAGGRPPTGLDSYLEELLAMMHSGDVRAPGQRPRSIWTWWPTSPAWCTTTRRRRSCAAGRRRLGARRRSLEGLSGMNLSDSTISRARRARREGSVTGNATDWRQRQIMVSPF